MVPTKLLSGSYFYFVLPADLCQKNVFQERVGQHLQIFCSVTTAGCCAVLLYQARLLIQVMRHIMFWNFQYVKEMLTWKSFPLWLQYLDLHGSEEQQHRKSACQRDLRIHDRKLPIF